MTRDLASVRRGWIVVKRVHRFITVFVLVSLTVSVPLFWRWTARHDAELLQGSQVVATAKGEIEVAVVDEGLPILQLHGSPGGYDQALGRNKVRPDRTVGVKTIAVSRPGFLRTPLTSGRTHEEQADLYAALLTTLGVPRVIVQGASGGSYSAIQLALRHPDRVSALILDAPDLGSQPMRLAKERSGRSSLSRGPSGYPPRRRRTPRSCSRCRASGTW